MIHWASSTYTNHSLVLLNIKRSEVARTDILGFVLDNSNKNFDPTDAN